MTGESLGRPIEGIDPGPLRHRYPNESAFLDLAAGPRGPASDMVAAVAISLTRFPDFNGADLAVEMVRLATSDRGYGQATDAALDRLREGSDWREAAIGEPGRSSFGSGAAVRMAAVGLLYADDAEGLRWVAEEAASITHRHALGCEGAALHATAVACAFNARDKPIDPAGFLLMVGKEAGMREFRERYESAARAVERELDAQRVIDILGNGKSALGSVATAAYCFARHRESFEHAVAGALALGGAASRIAAMTGAIAGAYLGLEAIPKRWREGLEGERIGGHTMGEIAAQLAAVHR